MPTDALTGFSQNVLPEPLSDKEVAVVGENGPADGLIIGQDGKMCVSSPQDDSAKVRDLSTSGAAPMVLVQDRRLRWPDMFAQGSNGILYLTSPVWDSAMYKPGAPIALWSFKAAGN